MDRLGWWGWWDQSLYIKSVAALARLDFRPEVHLYPIGYPAMGAIFYGITPLHPLLVPDIFFLVVIVVSLYSIYSRFISQGESIILVFATIFLHKSVLTNLVIPWSTIPTHALTYVIIYLLLFRQYKAINVIVAYICVTVIYWCRPGDILFVVPFFIFSIVNVDDKAGISSRLKTAILSLLPVLGVVLVVNRLFYGSYVLTPYLTAVSGGGFSLDNVPYKAYMIFIESSSFSGISCDSLLRYFPWGVLIGPGLVYALRQDRWRILTLIVSLLTPLLFYLSYNDFDYSTVFKYQVIHYIGWTFPLWALFGFLTVRYACLLSWKVFGPALALPILLVLFLRLDVATVKCDCDVYAASSEAPSRESRSSAIVRYTGGEKVILRVKFNAPGGVNGFYLSEWPWGDAGNTLSLIGDDKVMTPLRDYKLFNSSSGVVILFTRARSFNTLALSVNTGDYKTFTIYRPEFFRLGFDVWKPWAIF
ncbi:MAG: hypothetical protein HQL03_11290 [Nitrospirae bacterium]|nr:hypothetical protein [Nitrospirota bacterium]